jgi:hypothetical protein
LLSLFFPVLWIHVWVHQTEHWLDGKNGIEPLPAIEPAAIMAATTWVRATPDSTAPQEHGCPLSANHVEGTFAAA